MKSAGVRKANEKQLLRIMHNRGTVTQAEMAAQTGLQPSTVFRIFRSLEERGMVLQVEAQLPEEPRQGRRPGYYELNPRAACSLGVDLAHRATAILLVDFTGRAVRKQELEFPAAATAREVLDQLIAAIRGVLDSEGIDRAHLLGVGLGAPGVVDISAGRVVKYSRLPGMEGLPIRQQISGALGVPVFVQNNASVIALAENRFGRAAGHESVLAYLIRSGVGGAFVKNGQVYTSQGLTAFEVGHTRLNKFVGGSSAQDQTLEDILCEEALINRAHAEDPSVRDLSGLASCMASDDSAGCRALEPVAQAFFEHARNMALVLNPEALLIIARRGEIAGFFAKRLSRELADANGSHRYNVSTVIPLEYDPILACRGAADLVFDSYFSSE